MKYGLSYRTKRKRLPGLYVINIDIILIWYLNLEI